MNELEITFEDAPWQAVVDELQTGDTVCGAKLLTLLEDADEEQVQEALEALAEKQITLDIQALPKMPANSAAAVRLRREQLLAEKDMLPQGLEENDALRLYLEEIAQIPVAEDADLLAQRLAAGETQVLQTLTDGMLGEVVDIAKEYVGHGVLLLDLIQEASLGLWQGLQEYRDGDFTRHIQWWIRQYLAGAVVLQAKNDGVGQKLRQALEDYRTVDEKLLTELGRNPTMEEMAEAMHLSLQDTAVLADMLKNARSMQHIKAPEPEELPQEEDQAVEDTAYFQMRQRIAELMSVLPAQEAKLLSLRYGLEDGVPLNPQQVASRMGLTEEDVINGEAAALAKLRQQN